MTNTADKLRFCRLKFTLIYKSCINYPTVCTMFFKQTSCMESNLGLEESADKMFLKTIQERWKCTPKNRSEDGCYDVIWHASYKKMDGEKLFCATYILEKSVWKRFSTKSNKYVELHLKQACCEYTWQYVMEVKLLHKAEIL